MLVDGVVIDGCFLVDESMIIGEFVLVEKVVGDFVIGVIINGIGSLVIEVICVGVDIMFL